jgi:hypothetical protein
MFKSKFIRIAAGITILPLASILFFAAAARILMAIGGDSQLVIFCCSLFGIIGTLALVISYFECND